MDEIYVFLGSTDGDCSLIPSNNDQINNWCEYEFF